MAVVAEGRRPRLAWVLFATGILLAVAAFVMGVGRGDEGRELLAFTDDLPWFISFLLYIPVGALVASRHPSNPVGWLMLAMGLSEIVAKFSYEYAAHALVIDPGSLPGGAVMSWVSMWAWLPELTLLPTLLIIFPTGRALSRRWKAVGWIPIGWSAVFAVFVIALWPHRGPIFLRDSQNLGIESLTGLEDFVFTSYTAVMLCIVAALASLVVRFRRAHGVERQQLKWIALVAAFAAVNLVVTDVIFSSLVQDSIVGMIGETIAGPGAFALAAGIAILKYRLYDIDRIINRALVYGVLTSAWTRLRVGRGGCGNLRGWLQHHGGRDDPRSRRTVPAGAPGHSGLYRSALLPPQVRCRTRPGLVLGAASGRSRHRRTHGRVDCGSK